MYTFIRNKIKLKRCDDYTGDLLSIKTIEIYITEQTYLFSVNPEQCQWIVNDCNKIKKICYFTVMYTLKP